MKGRVDRQRACTAGQGAASRQDRWTGREHARRGWGQRADRAEKRAVRQEPAEPAEQARRRQGVANEVVKEAVREFEKKEAVG
eukprot:366057-Chlamydomonas_euryale.AAC.9